MGELTDDDELEREGKVDEAAGSAKNLAHQAGGPAKNVADKAKDAIDDAKDQLTGKD